MTVSALYPSVATPGAIPTAATSLAGAAPVGLYGTSVPTGAAMSALNGAQTASPSAASPEAAAMQQAIAELRAQGVPDASINQQLLAMQAQSGTATPAASDMVAAPTAAVAAHKATVATKKHAAVAKKPTTAAAKAKAAKAATAKKKSAAAATTKAAAVTTPVAAAAGLTGAAAQLPSNATALPGATVYSYADANNPGMAGLAGLSPQQQLQLGIMPTGLANGLTGAAEPQSNITNQSNVDPGALLGITGLNGLAGIGTGLGSVPTLGAPILGNANVSTPAASTTGAPAAPTTASSAGAQSVTNRNANDNGSFSQGVDPYASMYGGYGGIGGVGYGGIGTTPYTPYNTGIAGGLYSPYGASMQGAALTGVTNSGGIMGWLGRLFN